MTPQRPTASNPSLASMRFALSHRRGRIGSLNQRAYFDRLETAFPLPAIGKAKGNGRSKKGGNAPFASNKSTFRERENRVSRNDEVIDYLHVDHAKSLLECARKHLVCVTRFGDTGRMVVREDRRRGIA